MTGIAEAQASLEAVLKDEILRMYQEVADQPESTFHFYHRQRPEALGLLNRWGSPGGRDVPPARGVGLLAGALGRRAEVPVPQAADAGCGGGLRGESGDDDRAQARPRVSVSEERARP